jgi:hypothetical protein
LPRRRGVQRRREAALLIWQTVLCNGSAAIWPRCSRRRARVNKRSALDDCSAARCRATETSLVQSQHPCRKRLAAALARLKKICTEAPRRTAVQCGSPAGDRNTRGAVRATTHTAVQSGCPSPTGRVAAPAAVWAPTTAWRTALCRWATETSATQSG